jgi:hypothetical protein
MQFLNLNHIMIVYTELMFVKTDRILHLKSLNIHYMIVLFTKNKKIYTKNINQFKKYKFHKNNYIYLSYIYKYQVFSNELVNLLINFQLVSKLPIKNRNEIY